MADSTNPYRWQGYGDYNGWYCSGCGAFVLYGQTHTCPSSYERNFFPKPLPPIPQSPADIYSELKQIRELLQEINEKLNHRSY